MNSPVAAACCAMLGIAWAGSSYAQLKVLPDPDTLLSRHEDLLEQTQETEDLTSYDDAPEEYQAVFSLRSRFSMDLQKARGSTTGAYRGSPLKSYQRLKFSQGEHYSGAVLFTRDPGSVRLVDFITGNFVVRNAGVLSKAVIGDYTIESGQGILLWRSVDYWKGADVITPALRRAHGLVPYSSAGGDGFYRGAALEFRSGEFSAELVYSRREKSGTQGTENLSGARCMWSQPGKYRFGLTCFRREVGREMYIETVLSEISEASFPLAIDYDLAFSGVRAFGELALTGGSCGGVGGFLLQPSGSVNILTSLRLYPEGFSSPHGLPFGEGGSPSHETGIYFALDVRPFRGLHVSAYLDQYNQYGLRSGIEFPSAGSDLLFQAECIPVRLLRAKLRYGRKMNPGVTEKHTFSLEASYRVTPALDLKARLDHISLVEVAGQDHEKGVMISQGVSFRLDNHLSGNLMLIVFNTPSYETRLSSFEADLRGVRGVSVLYGRGIRYCGTADYKLSEAVLLSVKYSELIRYDVARIGSGAGELPSNRDNKISIQLDAEF